MAIRLQTANLTHDFADVRPTDGITSGYSKALGPNESMDMVVQHYISEPGSHTLRVSVQYVDYVTNEPKTIRKFYRFNVTSPIEIKASVHEINDNYCVQYQVTNMMKLPIYIEKVCSRGSYGRTMICVALYCVYLYVWLRMCILYGCVCLCVYVYVWLYLCVYMCRRTYSRSTRSCGWSRSCRRCWCPPVR